MLFTKCDQMAVARHTVNIAKLKSKLSEYIRAARDGETIRILDRQREVARLSGVKVPKGVRVAQRMWRKESRNGEAGKPRIKPLRPQKGPARLGDAVVEDRGRFSPWIHQAC